MRESHIIQERHDFLGVIAVFIIQIFLLFLFLVFRFCFGILAFFLFLHVKLIIYEIKT